MCDVKSVQELFGVSELGFKAGNGTDLPYMGGLT